jgi:enoyl-CoA hydratase
MTQTAGADEDGAIVTEKRGALLLIGIDRPRKLNGFSSKMVLELSDAFEQLERDEAMHVGVIHAIGPHFTAGVQLDQIKDWFAAGRHLAVPGKIDPFDLFEPRRTKPVVTAVQGICFTVGIELMLATDIVVAARDARFGQMEVRRGVFANHGATLRIVERAGWGNAMRYLLTGDEFDAETAYRLGLVQELVEPGRQLDRAIELAETIAAQAPLAVREMIASARKAVLQGWPAAIADLDSAQQRLMRTEDGAEGLRSFKEKRAGNFTGR